MPTAHYSRKYRSDRFNYLNNTDCLSENATSHSWARKRYSDEGAVRSSTKTDYGRRASHQIRETYFLGKEYGIQRSSKNDTGGFLEGYYSKARPKYSNKGGVRSSTKTDYGRRASHQIRETYFLGEEYGIQRSSKNDTGGFLEGYYSKARPKYSYEGAVRSRATNGYGSTTSSSLQPLFCEPKRHDVSKRSVIHEPERLSELKWRELENATEEEEREFLLKYFNEGKFQDVPVNCASTSVGDHLFYPGSFFGKSYEHHFLCVGVQSDGIKVIEYTGPNLGSGASSRSSSSSNPLAFAKLQRGYITFQKLKEKKTKKRLWPKELERFDDYEVVLRAENRMKKEGRWYNLLTNNCESFVNWCKCGLNVSLQVKPQYKNSWEAVKAVGSGVIQGAKAYAAKEATPFLIKAAANLSDDVVGLISSPLSPVGFAIGGLIEAGLLAKNISEDYEKKKQKIITERQFRVNTVRNSAKAFGRTSLGIAGAVIGSALGPFGTIAGGVVGAVVGHCAGAAVGWCYENAPKIKRFVQENVISPVKRFFKWLFS